MHKPSWIDPAWTPTGLNAGFSEFAAITGLQPTYLWPGLHKDVVKGLTLDSVNSAVEAVPVLGLKPNAITEYFFDFNLADTTAWCLSTPTLLELNQSWLQVVLWRASDPANSLVNIVGKRDDIAPNAGYELYVGAGGIIAARADDGPTTYDTQLAINHNDGQWHVIVLHADYSANEWQVSSELGNGTIATVPSLSTSMLACAGTDRLNTAGQEIAMWTFVRGPATEGIDGNTLAISLHNALVEDLGVGAELVLDTNYDIIVDGNGDPVYA